MIIYRALVRDHRTRQPEDRLSGILYVGPFVFNTDQPDYVTIRIHTTESEYVEAVLPVIIAPAFVDPLSEPEP